MQKMARGLLASGLAGAGMLLGAVPARGQILETETARPVGKGVFEIGSNFEYQVSSEGHEVALPFAIEYGFTNRLELLVEPVAYTVIRPKAGPRATGGGDLETTLTYLASRETSGTPAVALAGEVKFPTTNNTLIGTGKTDYTGYLIGSKRFGRLDTHADIGYTIVGHPAGTQLKNIWNFAFGWERSLGQVSELYGEFIGNTAASATPEPTGPTPPGITPEAPSGEFVASLGVARYVIPSLRLSLGLSIDNNSAVLFRPGFTIRTHR
jgi:hypothetical protein